CAFLDEEPRNSFAEPPGGAGDDCNLALQLAHASRSPRNTVALSRRSKNTALFPCGDATRSNDPKQQGRRAAPLLRHRKPSLGLRHGPQIRLMRLETLRILL